MKKTILALSLFVSMGAGATAATGFDLLKGLHSDDPRSQLLAMGYIVGAFDASQEVLHCAPDMPPSKIVTFAEAVLVNSPESKLRQMPGDYFIVIPMADLYPCESNGKI